jgi:HD-GYP domain-containing protein (c-di-GMP phosphodiesterase class II)
VSEEAILPGKTLQKPLVHPTTGNVLLPAGTVLTASYIERLQRQGLSEQLAYCLVTADPTATTGPPVAKGLDAFEIDIPALPEILQEFAKPATPPASATPLPAPAATPPSYVPTAAAPAWAAGQVPGAAPPVASAPVSPPVSAALPSPPVSLPPLPPPAAAVPPHMPGLRYYHNPQHMLPERALMAAMLAVNNVEQQVRDGKLPTFEPIERTVREVTERLAANQALMANGMDLRVVNQPHERSHPVNVFVLSVSMGLALGYEPARLMNLGVAALCHDIGKTAIPIELLRKNGALSQHEVNLLRAHTLMGKRIMEKLPWASAEIARVVYEHHERVDGSGYPLRLQGAQIADESKIVAVAEVYDALVSDTGYRPRYPADLCYNTIRNGEQMGFDAQVIRAFVRYIFPYPVNSFVMMDSGEIGQVLQNNRQDPLRPMVKVGSRTMNLIDYPDRKIANSHYQAY